MRAIPLTMLCALLAHLLVPACIVVDFLVDQERIAQELCVQRLVPDDMRTCHGDCYLSKKLKDVDARERDLPVAFRALKLDDATPQQATLVTFFSRVATGPAWPDAEHDLLPGCVPVSEPVPWC